MDEFAKVEKLVDITGATFEDARNALKACEGDMVDAVIYLQTLGKVYKNVGGKNVDQREALISEVERAKAEAERQAERAERNIRFQEDCNKAGKSMGDLGRRILRFLTRNQITISKDGERFASIPLLIAIVLCSVSIGFVLIACFVSMMFGYEYSFTGENDLEAANRAMAKAEKMMAEAADSVKAE